MYLSIQTMHISIFFSSKNIQLFSNNHFDGSIYSNLIIDYFKSLNTHSVLF
jgi:hypothetical protein